MLAGLGGPPKNSNRRVPYVQAGIPAVREKIYLGKLAGAQFVNEG